MGAAMTSNWLPACGTTIIETSSPPRILDGREWWAWHHVASGCDVVQAPRTTMISKRRGHGNRGRAGQKTRRRLRWCWNTVDAVSDTTLFPAATSVGTGRRSAAASSQSAGAGQRLRRSGQRRNGDMLGGGSHGRRSSACPLKALEITSSSRGIKQLHGGSPYTAARPSGRKMIPKLTVVMLESRPISR